MHILTGHKAAVRAVAYSPGPVPLVASAGDDRRILLWDPVSGSEAGQIENGRDGLLSMAFAPDGKRLAVGGRAGSVAVWDTTTLQRDPGAELAPGPVVTLAFTAGGRALLIALRSQDYSNPANRLLCWNLDPVHMLLPMDWSGDVESAAICPTRDLYAIASQARGVEFWEVGRPRTEEPAFWMPARVRAMLFSPGEGKRLAVASGRVVSIYDLEARRWSVRCEGHRGDVLALAFSPDGLFLLSGGMDRSVRLWEVLSGRQLAAWDWKIGNVNALAFSPDGMTATAGGDKPSVVVWDIDG